MKSLKRRSVSFFAIILLLSLGTVGFGMTWQESLQSTLGNLLGFAPVVKAESAPEPAPLLVGPVTVTGSSVDGDYGSLGAAFTAINGAAQTGNTITITISANTTEGASAVLNQGAWTSISIVPSGTVSVSGSIAGPLVDLNGADNVNINGGNSLTIENTLSAATPSVIRFIGDATSNTVQNCTIKSAETSTTLGTIFFSTGAVSGTGNDGNIITGNTITSSGANFATNAIYSSGTSTAIDNSAIQITNNNISDYFNAGSVTAGINVGATGNSSWTITGNKLFQSATRTYTTANTHSGIFVGGGQGYTISSNTIGFANSAGTGTTNIVGNSVALTGFPSSYTTTGTATATRYIAINTTFTAAGTVSNIQSNTIAGFALYTSSGATTTNGVWCGIQVLSGNANIGTTTGNTIGTASSSIYTAATTAGALIAPIYATSVNTVSIQNNTIQNLDAMGTTASLSGSVNGINTAGTAGNFNISGNTIGNATNPNIRMGTLQTGANLSNTGTTFGAGTGASIFRGILNAATGTVVIGTAALPNTIRNANINSTSTSARAAGIETTAGTNTIDSNSISNLTTVSGITNGNATASMIGISLSVTGLTHSITTNTIRDLSDTSGTAAVTVTGIYIGTTPGTTITKNFIFNLTTASTSTSSIINGINLFNSAATINIYNNMMRLGLGVGNNPIIRGVWDNTATSSPTNILFNSIYIDGTQGANAVNTACIKKDLASTMTISDNILWNNRASTGSPGTNTGRHYGIQVLSAAGNPISNGNDIYTPNNGGTIGLASAGTDQVTLANWRSATFQDLNSQNSDPKFVDPTNATTPDLHINPSVTTLIEGNGILLSPPTDDFDGQTRSGLTPVDIGADAGNFIGMDLTPPVITYTILGNTTNTTSRTLTISVTDASGVPTTGTGRPTLYYRKGTSGAYTLSLCNFTAGSSYDCIIPYVAIGGVIAGDTIQYFVAAQDNAATPNVTTNPSAGASGFFANPPLATTPPTTPNSYLIATAYSGPLTVDSAGAITSLTNAGGLFDKLNQGVLTGDLNVSINSDLTGELGTVALNAPVEEGVGGYTITIKPSGVAHAVSGAVPSTAMVRLNGASRVVFDGSLTVGGTDRSLTFENTSTTTPGVFRLGSVGTTPIVNDTIKNCVIRNGSNGSSAVTVLDTAGSLAGYFNNLTIQNNDVQKAFRGIFVNAIVSGTNGSGTLITGNTMTTAGANSIRLNPIFVAGANGVTISNNTMGNISDTNAEVPVGINVLTGTNNAVITGNTINGIVSSSTSSSASVSGIVISAGAITGTINVSNNNISTLTAAGTSASHWAIGNIGTSNVTIDNNTISGMTLTGSTVSWGIVVSGVTNNTISRNTISAMTISGSSSITSGINVQGASTGVTIERNKVFNIKNTNSSGWGANGIQLSSSSGTANTNVRNNIVYDVTAAGFNDITASDNGYGIIITGGAGYNVDNNTVHMNTEQASATGLPGAFNVTSGVTASGAINLRNNIFADTQTIGANRFAILSGATSSVFGTIDYNQYYSTGPNLGFIGSNRVDLAAVQAGFGGNVNSKSGDPLFVNNASDMHIQYGSPAKNFGVTLAAVANDFDGDLRPKDGPNYDIGADEFVDGIAPSVNILTFPANPTNDSSATFTFSGTDSLAPENVASFECALDTPTFTSCSSGISYGPGLTDGSHTFQVRAKDNSNNTGTPASYTWVIDTIAPNTVIDSGPSNPSNGGSGQFFFHGTDPGGSGIASFQCQLDGGGFSACTSPYNYSGLGEGSHTFQVLAIDAAGNADASPASYTWVVDTVAPDTNITANPTDPTNSTSASFSFTSTEGSSTFQCQIDSGGFSTCTSPTSYSSLADGSHTFQVKATDAAGNTDASPASYTWVIDTVGPDVSITSNPTDPTNSTSASFSFTSTEGGATFKCSLDGSSFTVCTSPTSYSSLANGMHTFQVVAVDALGNQSPSPASFTWKIDTIAPETTLDTFPANPTNQTSATFTFHGSDPGSGIAGLDCQLDSGGYSPCNSGTQSYSSLSNGNHVFEVRASDNAGNVDLSPATYAWKVDTIPPETSIDSNPTNPTNNTSATFSFSGSDSLASSKREGKPEVVSITFECSLDSPVFVPCTSSTTYPGLADGSHTFQVRARDAAGNADPTPASYTWVIDTAAPDTNITANPTNPTNSTSASFSFTSTEPGSTFQCQLDGGGFSTCTSPTSYSSLAEGSHTFQVKATDAAGNTDATPASYTWVIDTTTPDTNITANPNNPSNSSSASFSFNSPDLSATFECKLDGGSFTICASPTSYSSLADGSHTFQVHARDAAGNVDLTPASFTWTIDTAAPDTTLDTTPTNPTASNSAAFTFHGTDSLAMKQQGKELVVGLTFECKLDGGSFTPCTSPANYSSLADGSHTFQVKATDTAGNTDASAASFTWVIDTTAPDTNLTANPANPTNSTSAAFSFTGNDGSGVGGVTFECQIDGGSYVSCVSGVSYSSLLAGPHTFNVRAKDSLNNTDASPAGFAWTIDLAPPVIAPYTPLANTVSTSSRIQTVNVTDNLAVASVTLHYAVNGGGSTSAACVLGSGPGNWDCTVPGQSLGTSVAYYVTATDTATNNAVPVPAAANPFLYTVGAATVPAGTYSAISLSNSSSLGGNVTVIGNLDLGGIVTTGANNLTLGCGATVSGAGTSSYVVGDVKKDFCGAGSFVYPVGTLPNGAARGNDDEALPEGGGPTGEYSPATITVLSGTFPSSLTINVQDAFLPGLGTTSSLSRYWNVTETGDLTVNMTFQYLPEDIYGTEASYVPFKWNGSTTIQQPGSVNAAADQFTATNVSSFSGWGAGVAVPTAASANISGRVLTAGGMPIANVKVVLTGGGLDHSMVVYTGQLGYYNFENIATGQNYVVTVKSRRFTFTDPSHLLTLFDNVTDGDFIADPQP